MVGQLVTCHCTLIHGWAEMSPCRCLLIFAVGMERQELQVERGAKAKTGANLRTTGTCYIFFPLHASHLLSPRAQQPSSSFGTAANLLIVCMFEIAVSCGGAVQVHSRIHQLRED